MNSPETTIEFETLTEAIFFSKNRFISGRGFDPHFLILTIEAEVRLKIELERKMPINESKISGDLKEFLGMTIVKKDGQGQHFELGY